MSAPDPSDRTDAQWAILRPRIPPDRSGGSPRTVDIRRVVNAIVPVHRTGCQWRPLPHDVPNWRLGYDDFSTRPDCGRWPRIPDALLAPTRWKAGETEGPPSAGRIDRSTVKATAGPTGARGPGAGNATKSWPLWGSCSPGR